jgi:hypothetical protein
MEIITTIRGITIWAPLSTGWPSALPFTASLAVPSVRFREHRKHLKVILVGSPEKATNTAADLRDDGPMLSKPYDPPNSRASEANGSGSADLGCRHPQKSTPTRYAWAEITRSALGWFGWIVVTPQANRKRTVANIIKLYPLSIQSSLLLAETRMIDDRRQQSVPGVDG